MRIAKVFKGDPNNRKGFFNNVIERTKRLISTGTSVDCYIILEDDSYMFQLVKHKKLPKQSNNTTDEIVIDNITFKVLYIKSTLSDYILTHKINKRPFVGSKHIKKHINIFKDYDVLSTHGIAGNYLGYLVYNTHNIPFVPTWHGSDINVNPFKNSTTFEYTKRLLDSAACNLFVSKRLLEASKQISDKKNKEVFYTGPADYFYKFNDIDVDKQRQQYNIHTKYVVGFIGNLKPVKNVLILPKVFNALQSKYKNDITFIVVGDGELQSSLLQSFSDKNISNLIYIDKLSPNEVPAVMNILNVLVIPSLNEGMPRVTLEAQVCGVHVVGSDRGGIPEAIGGKNCFTLDDKFVSNITDRIDQMLIKKVMSPSLPDKFKWESALKKEIEIFKMHINAKDNL